MRVIAACLPDLLGLRPKCRARIISFAARRAESAKLQHIAEIAALLPPMPATLRQRVEIIASPNLETYVKLLQYSTAYVYITAPAVLSTGLLEAMSCATLVLASDTAPVREIIRHEENGLLWSGGDDPTALAGQIARLLASHDAFAPLRRKARERILEHYDIRALLPHHADVVLDA